MPSGIQRFFYILMIFRTLAQKILILDGAMGTMIQRYNLSESDYRGSRFAAHSQPLKGNHEVLVLTQPELICDIHRQYIEAGADIVTTCSFCANEISQHEYGLSALAPEMAFASAQIARRAAGDFARKIYVAGSVGPTNTSLSLATDPDNPAARPLSFGDLERAFEAQIDALVEGGADFILIETVFDALNAKAALYALANVRRRRNLDIPVMVSAAPADDHGRLLSGQTLEAFVDAIAPFRPLSIGLNCGSGAEKTQPLVRRFAACVPGDIGVGYYPNAGLPDDDGCYPDDPERFAAIVEDAVCNGCLNIVGGCCGTTPRHIQKLAQICEKYKPRALLAHDVTAFGACFSGLESYHVSSETGIIAERANVTGSKKFKRLVEQKLWDEAVSTARAQMQKGACMFDVCMDDALLDAPADMREFLRRIAADPTVSRYPAVIDSSDFEVIRTGLRECQGRCLVNSISLKEGEEAFLQKAREIRDLGGAVIVMAFDEQGQASTTERRVEILTRAVGLLTQKLGFRYCDIALDPNILAIGTGLEEHRKQALSFIETCRIMRRQFPGILTAGGLSNLSFAFRGRDDVRSAIHRVFLELARDALSLVIANPAMLKADVPEELRALAYALVTDESDHALEDLLSWMQANQPVKNSASASVAQPQQAQAPADRLREAFVLGGACEAQALPAVRELRQTLAPLQIIEGPLMAAMNEVGERFGRGDMYLPQIVKAARLMKQCIDELDIAENQQKTTGARRKILLATVRGDVHDIGKNIVSIVLTCNGYEVIDLGVMVETERIVREALAQHVDAIGLSGLISPSLKVMVEVAQALKAAGVDVPLFVGGAAANALHTALKIAPAYAPGTVAYIADASRVPGVLGRWLDPKTKDATVCDIRQAQSALAAPRPEARISLRPIALARSQAQRFRVPQELSDQLEALCAKGLMTLEIPAAELIEDLDFAYLARSIYGSREVPKTSILKDLRAFFANYPKALATHARIRFMHARPVGDDIELLGDDGSVIGVLYGVRAQQENLEPRALSDFVDEHRGVVGLFALTTPHEDVLSDRDRGDGFLSILVQGVATALVECANQSVHRRLFEGMGPYILPAIGYPICPDHELKSDVLRLLGAEEIGICLTESQMMVPLASVCGFSIVNPQAVYYHPGQIGEDQRADYARRRRVSPAGR